MRFEAEQQFATTVDRLVEWFTDPDFYPTLAGLPQISTPEVVRHSVTGDRVELALHQRYTGDLPSAAQAVLDPSRLTWVEELVFDLMAGTATTRLVPDHYPDRLTCQGRYRFETAGTGSIRRLEGDLKVRAPLVGGRVERALVEGLQRHAEGEQDLIVRRLADGTLS